MEVQYDWSTLGCVSTFQFALSPIGVLFQNEFMYTEVTSVYSSEHCGHWCTPGVGSVTCDYIT